MKTIIPIAFLSLLCLFTSSAKKPAIGTALPKLAGLLPGATLPNTSGKVVLVDFWASWCVPCKASFPSMDRLQQKYGPKGLVIIGIGVDEDAKKYQAFIAKNKVNFTLVHDSQHKAAGYFNPPSMPSSYLVDRKGNIRYIHQGFKGAKTEEDYTKEIEELLGK